MAAIWLVGVYKLRTYTFEPVSEGVIAGGGSIEGKKIKTHLNAVGAAIRCVFMRNMLNISKRTRLF